MRPNAFAAAAVWFATRGLRRGSAWTAASQPPLAGEAIPILISIEMPQRPGGKRSATNVRRRRRRSDGNSTRTASFDRQRRHRCLRAIRGAGVMTASVMGSTDLDVTSLQWMAASSAATRVCRQSLRSFALGRSRHLNLGGTQERIGCMTELCVAAGRSSPSNGPRWRCST